MNTYQLYFVGYTICFLVSHKCLDFAMAPKRVLKTRLLLENSGGMQLELIQQYFPALELALNND